MFTALLHKVFGSKNDRELKKLRPIVAEINSFEAELSSLNMEELRAKTEAFRERIREKTQTLRSQCEEARARAQSDALRGEDAREEREQLKEEAEGLEKELRQVQADVLDELLPEAFATVREVSRRITGMRHFDSQMVGGIVLHQGRIAEMKTGEGKTLVATLSVYLNALLGRGVHLITVNDYLARRDVQWMGPIYHALGLSIASIVHDSSFLFDPTYLVKDYRYINLRPIDRKEAYAADITYGTNNEFGFDYLRDNMKFSLDDYVQRELQFAIVDEVDNILIDEARTPLIISGPAEESTDKYYAIDRVIPRLQKDADFASVTTLHGPTSIGLSLRRPPSERSKRLWTNYGSRHPGCSSGIRAFSTVLRRASSEWYGWRFASRPIDAPSRSARETRYANPQNGFDRSGRAAHRL